MPRESHTKYYDKTRLPLDWVLRADDWRTMMAKLIPVDVSDSSLDILRDLSIRPRKRKPGPPERIDGMTVGIFTLTEDAPHDGEMHPDGDEVLHVIYGKVRVSCDASPNEDLVLGPGDTCIVPQGEWHKVSMIEESRIIHITPGPGGEHRPLGEGGK